MASAATPRLESVNLLRGQAKVIMAIDPTCDSFRFSAIQGIDPLIKSPSWL